LGGTCTIWDSNAGGEGCCFALNGNSTYFSNPGDNQSLWYGDEDLAGVGGGWYITVGGSLVSWSDRRLKENIIDYNYIDILEKYKQIKLYSYNLKRPVTNTKSKSDDKYAEKHIGVMADEICHIFSECIGRSKFTTYKNREAKLEN
jgi:hypothetical protein